MIKKEDKKIARRVRHRRVRSKVVGLPGRPRLNVCRSGNHIYAQLIEDTSGRTLAAASTLEEELRGKFKSGGNIEAARAVGALIAARAKEKGINQVVFDRGGYLYHGRVAALAAAAREAGLEF